MKTSMEIWVSRSNGGQFGSNFGGCSEMLQMDPADEPRSFSMFQNYVRPDENTMILKMLIAKGGCKMASLNMYILAMKVHVPTKPLDAWFVQKCSYVLIYTVLSLTSQEKWSRHCA